MSRTFLAQFGFFENPFESTNADNEPALHEYSFPLPTFRQ